MVMESTDGLQGRWNAATNWTVTGGSLANFVAVESFDTPIYQPGNIVSNQSPLILRPPSSDSIPCEITINFSKRHEVRQVYVRSTARVYEMYVSSKVQDGNEYLCTVRCGAAAKELISDVAYHKESPCLGESNHDLDEEKSKHGNDEEWVEVKVPNASAVTNGVSSASINPYMDMDLYEATAEISDADPCISLTLRLVSIQSRGCVYVDEVYVFADPIDFDSDIQEDKAVNLAGSSALAMLIPSILQISRAKDASLEQNKHTLGLRDNRRFSTSEAANMDPERLPKVYEVPATANKRNEEEMKHIGPTVVEQPRQTSLDADKGGNLDVPCGRVETLLEQLVSRVSRMEDLYLRFEESMLRPINSIEARLQQVEHKIESLVEGQLNYGERRCKRFSAPEFSLSESNVNSLYGNETENDNCGEFDHDKKESSDKFSVLHEDITDTENTPHFVPCLTVTAPDFSQGDEDDNSLFGSVFDSAKEKPRHVSIDDALASALAGFMSSIPVQPQKHSQSLVVRAPEFSNEEDENYEEEEASPEIKLNVSADSSLCMKETDGMKFTEDSLDCIVSSVEGEVDYGVTDTAVEESNKEQHNEIEVSQETKEIGEVAGKTVVERSKSILIVQSIENGEAATEISFSLALDDTEASNEMLEAQVSGSSPTWGTIHARGPLVTNEDSQGNIIQDLLAYSGSGSVVDYKTPIFDVTFSPQENSGSKTTTLEGLFGDESEPTLTPTGRIHENSSAGGQRNFIELDEMEPLDQIASCSFSLNVEYCNLPEMEDKSAPHENYEELSAAGSPI